MVGHKLGEFALTRKQLLHIKRKINKYGTKVNPKGFRLGQTANWDSNWRAANKIEFSKKFHLDVQIKELISTTLNHKGILVGKLLCEK